jgi:apolipoprotein N-acyltransferase
MQKFLNAKGKSSLLSRLATALIGGYLSSFAFPRENLYPLIFVSVALLMISIYRLSILKSMAVGFTGGLAFYLSQIEWLSLYLGPIPWLALSVLEAIIFCIGMVAMTFCWQQLEKTNFRASIKHVLIAATLALLWTSREWVSITVPYGGFPWSRLSQTQADSFLSRWAYWAGLGWLTFVVAFIAALFALLVLAWLNRQERIRFSTTWPSSAIIVLLTLMPALTTIDASAEAGSIKIAAVQGNANAGLFANTVRGSILQNHLDASLLIANQKVDLVVWPENASDLSPFTSAQAREKIQDFVDNQVGVPLIFGTITERGSKAFNSSIFWEPGIGPTDWYDKKRPVPFAEYVPDRDFWYQLAPDLIGLVSRGYEFGQRDGIFEINGSKLGALICFEIAIDDIGKSLVQDGAQVILSQTNNADFGKSDETFQQAAFARLRAIETGRTVVNISTVGVSAIYLADGSVVQELKTFEAGAMIQDVPLRKSITPAMLIGSWVDLFMNLMALSLITLSLWLRSTSKKKRTA